MAKNRRKMRRKRPRGQAAAPPPQVLRPSHVAREARPDVVAARPGGPGSEGTVVGTVVGAERESIWIEVGGERAMLYASELMLGIGERPAERYAVGDRFEAFVFQMGPDPESGAAQFSIRRASPYPETLAGLEVGAEVQATVVNTYDAGIELDVGGVRGNVYYNELPLQPNETPHQRYDPGETIESVLVGRVDQEARHLTLSIKRSAPGYVEALQQRAVGDVVSGTVTDFEADGGLWIDVDGVIAAVLLGELALAGGESAQDRYSVGETIGGLVVWQVDHEDRRLSLSVKRNASSYVETLQRRAVGDVVSGTVTDVDDGGWLWLDVDGLVGSVAPDELALDDRQSTQERYTVGETIESLFVLQVDHKAHDLDLSVKRNAPSYVEALQRCAVGDIVAGTVTDVDDGGWLWLDVDGLVGSVAPDELALDDRQSTQERYTVGETIEDLFVWQVDHEARTLSLSVKRNAPGYVEALQQCAVGDIASGTITYVGDGLLLDVDGLVGVVPPYEIVLTEGESIRERHTVGETIDGLFVWQVEHDSRRIALSAKRNTPGYVEALNAHSLGEVVSATVADVSPGGLWLDVQGAIGWIFEEETLLEDGETLAERYSVGDPVTAVVGHIDRESRTVLLSARRVGLTLVEEPIVLGATIKAMVVRKRAGGIDVSVDGKSEIYVPDYALSLRPGGSADLEMGQEIDVVVMDVKDGAPTVLSHRRALGGWEAARDRLTAGIVVPGARVIPWVDRPNRDDGRAAVDLGPVTGFIPLDERNAEAAEDLMSRRANRQHRVVVKGLDEDVWTASVSEAEFEARWRELVDSLPTDEGVEGEIIDIARGVATLDLGSGLLGEMSVSELPPANGDARLGEVVTVGIRSVDREEYRIVVEIQNYELMQMIAADETLVCELKEVFLKAAQPESLSARRNRQDVNQGVVRAMAGMMNRDGGHVIVGVEDTDKKDGAVVGWEASGWENQNEMATALSNLVSDLLGPTAGGLCTPRFERLPDGHEVLDIECDPADEPIFLTYGDTEEFPVRYSAMTKKLRVREAHEYIRERFSG